MDDNEQHYPDDPDPQNIGGDYVGGDKFTGDKVAGNKTTDNRLGIFATGITTYNITNRYAPTAPLVIEQEALIVAAERLQELPLHTVPAPAPLPPGSRMLFSHNPLFVGRGDAFLAIARALTAGDTAAIGQIAAATGLGGIGKTQLASEFAHRYGQYFVGGVFWLNFSEAANIAAEIAICSGPGFLALRPTLSALAPDNQLALDDQVALVRAAWQSPLPRLLIFDNCENEELFARWRPLSGGCRILITSRREHWDLSFGITNILLDILPRTDSIALLRAFRPEYRPDDPNLDAIAAELGDLPLALHLAGSFLRTYQPTSLGAPDAYLARLRHGTLLQHPSLQGDGASLSPTNHALHVARTFDISYKLLMLTDPVDALAIELAQCAMYLAWGEPIPRELLYRTLDLSMNDEEAVLRVEKSLTRLNSLGLLQHDSAIMVRLHRLLAQFLRDVAADEQVRAAVEQALLNVTSDLIGRQQISGMRPLLPHLRDVATAAYTRADTAADALTEKLGHALMETGDFAGATRAYSQLLALREHTLGSQHPTIIVSLDGLVKGQIGLGQLTEARITSLRALRLRTDLFGSEDLRTVEAMHRLGHLLENLGDLEQAQVFLSQSHSLAKKLGWKMAEQYWLCLLRLPPIVSGHVRSQAEIDAERQYYADLVERDEREWGKDHPQTAQSLHYYAVLLPPEDARPLYERALDIREQVLGSEHPETADTRCALGVTLYRLGDYSGAQACYKHALATREATLGPFHPDIAENLYVFGDLLVSQGDFVEAQSLYVRALAICDARFSPMHRTIANICYDLGDLLDRLGDYLSARQYYMRALAIQEQILGPAHINTTNTRNGLIRTLRPLEDPLEARSIYEQVITACERQSGPNTPDMALALHELGVLLAVHHEDEQARLYYEWALAIWERAPASQLAAATASHNLARLLLRQEDRRGAQGRFAQTLAIHLDQLGPDDPSTIDSLTDLTKLLRPLEDPLEARSIYEQVIAACERQTEPNTPDTASALHELGALLAVHHEDEQARLYYERALAIWERAPASQLAAATASHNLARLLLRQEDRRGAQGRFAQTLAIRLDQLGPDDPRTTTSLTELIAQLRPLEDPLEARSIYEQVIAARERQTGLDAAATASALHELGVLLDQHHENEQARLYYERALAIWERAPANQFAAATASRNLAHLLLRQHDRRGAQERFAQTLAIRLDQLGPDDPRTTTSLIELIAQLRPLEDLLKARSIYEQVIAARERQTGLDAAATASALHELGVLLDQHHEDEQARLYYERALAIWERKPASQLAAATASRNLAHLLLRQHDRRGAQERFAQALAIRLDQLGPDDPRTITSLTELIAQLRPLEDPLEARSIYEQVIAARERQAGLDASDMAWALHALGVLLAMHHEDEQARLYYERALAIWEREPASQLAAATAHYNLAHLLLQQHDRRGAQERFAQALAIRLDQLGPDDPRTITSLTELITQLRPLEDPLEAQSIYEQVIAARGRQTEPNTSDMAWALHALGVLLAMHHENEQARLYYERVLVILHQLSGEDLSVTTSMYNLENLLNRQGDKVMARRYYEYVLTMCIALLGENHPDTGMIRDQLDALTK